MATNVVKFLHIYVIVTLSLLCAIRTEALSLGYDPYTARDSRLNSYLKTVLDPVKEYMTKGFPEYGIPVLDPFVFGNISKSISNEMLNISLFAQDITVSGLSNFSLLKLEANLKNLENLSVAVKIVFHSVTANSAYYNLNGYAANSIPLYGDGEVSVLVSEIEIDVGLAFSIATPKKIKINDISLDVDYGHARFLIESIMGGGNFTKFANSFLSSPRAKKYFNLFKPDLLRSAEKFLKEKASEALSKLDLSKINV